jgi:hypothetical protein
MTLKLPGRRGRIGSHPSCIGISLPLSVVGPGRCLVERHSPRFPILLHELRHHSDLDRAVAGPVSHLVALPAGSRGQFGEVDLLLVLLPLVAQRGRLGLGDRLLFAFPLALAFAFVVKCGDLRAGLIGRLALSTTDVLRGCCTWSSCTLFWRA